MKLRHQDNYEWYINSCNRCKTCVHGPEGDESVCPSVDLYEMFTYSGGGKAHLALAAIEERIKKWEDIADPVYSCTFCGACYSLCPVTIDLYDLILDLREIVFNKGYTPASLKKLSENLKKKDNPYGKKKKFIPPEGVKIYPGEKGSTLFFTGCQARTNRDAYESAKAVLKILLKAGVDVIILKDEPCCGSPVLETGDYKTFKTQAHKVIKTIKETGAEEVVIHCPHGYSTFLFSYDLPEDFPEIYLFADYVKMLIEDNKIKFKKFRDKFTFHDPCRISHYTDESDIFRELFSYTGKDKLKELPRHGKESYCCGNPFITPYSDKKLYEFTTSERKNEIINSGNEILVTACPGCNQALKDDSYTTIDLPLFLLNLIK